MNKVDWKGILVYLELDKNKVKQVGLELLSKACQLSRLTGDPVYAAAAGKELTAVKEQLAGFPLQEVHLYESDSRYHTEEVADMLKALIKELKPAVVLIGGTIQGRTLASGIAVAFKTGVTADCTELEIDQNGSLVQTRPAFGGNIMASIVTEQARPQIATVRPGIFQVAKSSQNSLGKVIMHERSVFHKNKEMIRVEKLEYKKSICDAAILVAAGRGIAKKEDLEMLRELAALLGGRLAASRALVEKGWMSPEDQIGLSGNTVSPDYLITVGISGTVQFITGMKTAKNIIAINSDADAPIFQVAHYPICGDLYDIIPECIKTFR